MDLNKLRDSAYTIACEHGWHDNEQSDETLLMLIITELAEAVNADRKDRHAYRDKFHDALRTDDDNEMWSMLFEQYIKDSVEDELADVVIRSLDLAGSRGFDLTPAYLVIERIVSLKDHNSFAEICYYISGIITSEPDAIEERICFVLAFLIGYCQFTGIDLDWHVEQKMKYNSLRPYKHGDKKY